MAMRELAKLIGREATWLEAGLSIPVQVVDVREVFGRVDVLITPVGGTGQRWVDRTNITTESTEGDADS